MRLLPLALVFPLLVSAALADGPAAGSELIGTSWRLQQLAGAEVAATVETTLNIDADGIGGRGGCNSYGGGFEPRPDGIAFTQVFSTMMACPEPAMGQEQAWLAALENTQGYRLEGTTLTLLAGDGSPLATLTAL